MRIFLLQVSFPEFDSDTWSLALQQILLFVLIIGRWMLPRGTLNHGKLSNVLLLQIAMAADILEFLSEGVRTDEVLCIESVIIGALVLWTVSLLQLPFHFDTKTVRRMSDFARRKSQNTTTLQRLANSEVWEIATVVILQDGPFLCMRLFFLFYLGIFNQGLIFFIAKNCLVLVLQLYRLWALLCVDINEDGKRSFKLTNMIRATLRGSRQSPDSRDPELDKNLRKVVSVPVDDASRPNDGESDTSYDETANEFDEVVSVTEADNSEPDHDLNKDVFIGKNENSKPRDNECETDNHENPAYDEGTDQ